jgi:Luciferase-like monooxygenase
VRAGSALTASSSKASSWNLASCRSDLQTSLETGRPVTAVQRVADTIDYAVLAERLGLDLFALGEHHTIDFAVSSPAVVLAAIAPRTEKIRLTTAVIVLRALDPVRVYQDVPLPLSDWKGCCLPTFGFGFRRRGNPL